MCQCNNWAHSGPRRLSPSVARQRRGETDELAAQRPLQPLSCLEMTHCGSIREVGVTGISFTVLSPAPSAVKNGIKMPKQSS